MKKVIFDVDGVLFSEERYFDVCALTVWEWLYSPAYLGLPGEQDDFSPSRLTEGQIAWIREKVWDHDRLFSWLKSHGINSNYDMVHADLVVTFWLMAQEYRNRTGEVPELFFRTPRAAWASSRILMGIPVPKASAVLERLSAVVSKELRGSEVFDCLADAVTADFGRDLPWVHLQSEFWQLHREAFENWYLGDDVFIHTFGHLPHSGGKEGFLQREVPLAPAGEIRDMFRTLKQRGYGIAIATGRSRAEMGIPFRMYHWEEEFDPMYIGTADEAAAAMKLYPGTNLDKPHPFTYDCALFGNQKENYKGYIDGTFHLQPEDEAWVIGDSRSDVWGARSAGAGVIGVLTGLEGSAARSMFEEEKIEHIIDRVTDVLDILK